MISFQSNGFLYCSLVQQTFSENLFPRWKTTFNVPLHIHCNRETPWNAIQKLQKKNVYSSTFNAFEFYAGLEIKVDEWRINHKSMHINIESTLYFVFERISYYISDDCNTLGCSTIQLYYILDSERTYWFLWLNDRYMYFVLEYLFRKTLCGLL